MSFPINIQNSQVSIIRQLLAYSETKNEKKPFFKKTEKAFKKKYGIDLVGAPVIFKRGGFIYKLSFMQDNYPSHLGGRKWEDADYLPIVSVGKFFERLNFENQIK